jgi:hypothetical protein
MLQGYYALTGSLIIVFVYGCTCDAGLAVLVDMLITTHFFTMVTLSLSMLARAIL